MGGGGGEGVAEGSRWSQDGWMGSSSLREAPSCGQKHLYHRNSCTSADLCISEDDTGNETKGGYCHYLNVIYD